MSFWESIVWGSPHWRTPALVLGALAAIAVLAAYVGIRGPQRVRLAAGALKAVALIALLLCLLEPMRREERPRPGANLFVVLADNSRSLTLGDAGGGTVQQQVQRALADTAWQTRLGQDFDVRRYQFDDRLRATGDWETLDFAGRRSALAAALRGIEQRFQGQPVAGILLLTDGNSTDAVDQVLDEGQLPPLYPVQFRRDDPAADVRIDRVSIRQTNFEDSPVAVTTDLGVAGYDPGAQFKVELLGADDEVLDEFTAEPKSGDISTVELNVRPDEAGIHVYRLRVSPTGPAASRKESTKANNQRLVMVHRRRGPYRLLYVAGRPNWEFKFLRRAVEEDTEMDLVGLLRIARKEPKFVFRDRDTGDENNFFQGFEDKDREDTEQYDQPVLVRIGVEDASELRDGFPRDAETLFGFHAVVLDDIESQFFDEDQLSLIQEFVSQRGGALLMLGGAQSLASGGYERTPLGDMLPVYLDDTLQPLGDVRFRWKLSREGWLQPWVRMRDREDAERKRIGEMPTFETINMVRRVKPGATVLASVLVEGADGVRGEGPIELPALASQRYGKGRAAALMIGDYWKWAMARPDGGQRDLEKAWRQMLRYLISDAPARVEAIAEAADGGQETRIRVEVRDEAYRPLDNAEVRLAVSTPDGREVQLLGSPAAQAGVYEARFANREPGPYLVQVEAADPDGHQIGKTEAGWTHEPEADEFQSQEINQPLLERLAERTDGELAPAAQLERFVGGIAKRRAVVNETWMRPLWHRWYVFLLAALCLAGEWGLRRWHGLP